MAFFLGIDLGTTAAKIALIDEDKKTVLERDEQHNALLLGTEKGRHEQSAKKILNTVLKLMEEIETDKLAQVEGIAISGQMHGVILWEANSIGFGVEHCNCSPLITWMDSRCDEQFLQKLPKWMEEGEPKKEKRIATGYGMATLAWLKEKGQLNGQKWDSAGTIMDFLVSLLTQSKNAFISSQNAESWGFVSDSKWTFQINDALLFPTHLLPSIVCPGTVIGRTSLPFAKLPKGIPVLVALGDLQASLLPFLSRGVAALHIGTASQIAFISRRAEEMSTIVVRPNSVRCDPFFDGEFLLVAPSLNGGNVFACLFRQIGSWSAKLFGFSSFDSSSSSFSAASSLLERVLNTEHFNDEASVEIVPTFFGERHISTEEGGAVVKNWKMDTTIEEFLLSVARGIVANLAQMMPPAFLISHSVHTIKLIGRANQKAFAEEAKKRFPGMKIVLGNETFSAAYGAAMHAKDTLME